MKKKNVFLLRWGIAILALGIIFNILMFVYETWPTYLFLIFCLIGILQIFLSLIPKKIKIGWQMFWSIIPFLILYLLILADSPSKDIFLIPNGYRGEVIVEYGSENGVKKESEGFWRVYRIPKNGKLKTQYELKGESIDLSSAKYFYIDKQGNKKSLNVFCETCKDKDTSSVQIVSIRLYHDSQTFYVDVPNKGFEKKIRN